MTRQQILTIAALSIVYGAIAIQQSAAFGVCLDLGHRSAGAIIGVFNTVCQLGGLAGSVAFGYVVDWTHSYNAPFFPMAAFLSGQLSLVESRCVARPRDGVVNIMRFVR